MFSSRHLHHAGVMPLERAKYVMRLNLMYELERSPSAAKSCMAMLVEPRAGNMEEFDAAQRARGTSSLPGCIWREIPTDL